jgi:hypothetical protein
MIYPYALHVLVIYFSITNQILSFTKLNSLIRNAISAKYRIKMHLAKNGVKRVQWVCET